MKIIGLDLGTSNIKIIATDEMGKITNKAILKKMPIIDAFQVFIKNENIQKEQISKIVVTGIGQNEITENIEKIRTIRVDEFQAIGKGATYLANIKNALIISIGTGTAFVKAENDTYKHIGGSGIGGGTLIKLCEQFAGISDFSEIEKKAENADLTNVDLRLKDIKQEAINDLLPMDITVANFGKLNDKATNNDIILGILNMVFETIGMMGVFATQNISNKNIIVIGSVTELTYLRKVLDMLNELQKVNFVIPNNSEWAVAQGAVQLAKDI